MAIEVLFTGLIMICLDGELNCPKGNIAWVVKADGKSTVCGRESKEETELEVRFPVGQFVPEGPLSQGCKVDANNSKYTQCPVPNPPREIYLGPDTGSTQRLDKTLRRVPGIDEVDRRFKKLDISLLEKYVPTRIHFPHGTVGGGDIWPPDPNEPPREWSRSNGKADKKFPRYLSDSLKVTYEGLGFLELKNYEGQSLIKLTRAAGTEKGELIIRNRAMQAPSADLVNGYYNLAYLIWYYRLGVWNTGDHKCPVYTDGNKDAVMLRCAEGTDHKSCAFFGPNPDVDHTKWPAVRGPKTRRRSAHSPRRRHLH